MINKDFLYCDVYTKIEDLSLVDGSLLICATGEDERTSLCKQRAAEMEIRCVYIQEVTAEYFISSVSSEKIPLRIESTIESFLYSLECTDVYIDVTGVDNRFTAPFLKCALKLKLNIHVLYVEPLEYDKSMFKRAGFIYDLAKRIDGISPLPMFTALHRFETPQYVFMLGFEGGRFQYMSTQLEPEEENVVPVVGVPGYRLEYPFVAIQSNAYTLRETNSMNNLRYAEASSIVDACFLLKHLMKNNPYLCIAPIGTKPHVVASILFAIKYPENVEIYYDNPCSSFVKTHGVGRIIDCNVSKLLQEI